MALTARTSGSTNVVELSGNLDAATAPEIRRKLNDMVDSGHTRLVLDLGEVQFVDSSGLSVLVSTLKNVRAHHGDVALLNLTPPVRSLVELTRLHRILEIFTDEASAVAKVSEN